MDDIKQTLGKVAAQVPALIVLVAVVYMFLAHIEKSTLMLMKTVDRNTNAMVENSKVLDKLENKIDLLLESKRRSVE